jgi:hypothetical protein
VISTVNALVMVAVYGSVSFGAWCALLALSVILSAHAAWRWKHAYVGLLSWTGNHWAWLQVGQMPKPEVCELRWAMDFQAFVLVRMRLGSGGASTHWIWLERGKASPSGWLAFRRALVPCLVANGFGFGGSIA